MPSTSDNSSDTVSERSSLDSSNTSTSSLSPTKSRRRPAALRLGHVGIDPDDIIGKVLRSVRRSAKHPSLTLNFADNTSFQILVDGYDPTHPGVPKQLEMDSSLDQLFDSLNGNFSAALPIVDCALITLTDKAFERKQKGTSSRRGGEEHWDQNHIAIAFKFAEEIPHWHCVWATLQEFDQDFGCIFRSYDDVFLQKLQRSPLKARHRTQSSQSGGWKNRN